MKILDFGRKVLKLDYSKLQDVWLLASNGEELTPEQEDLFEKHAGRPYPGPGTPPHEVGGLSGRQSGKTGYVGATIALYAAMDPRTVEGLGPGQSRDVVILAPTQRQARIAFQRITGLVQRSPELRRYLKSEPTQHEIEFDFGVRVGVWAARGAHVRGIQPRLLFLDEVCFLPIEGPRADYDLIDSTRPGMAMVPGAQLIWISSPWVEQGYAYDTYRKRAELADTFVFQAASWELNPLIPKAFLDRERERDPEMFRREYGGEFVGTIEAFLPAASIEACCVKGRAHLPPRPGVRYVAAIDQAYKQDQFVLGIGHTEDGRIVVDKLRGWKPRRGSPVRLEMMLPDLEAELKAYRVHSVFGDQFGAEAFREVLRGHGLQYTERTFTSDSKRDMYGSLKQAVIGEAIELLDDAESLRELRTLEARATPGGGLKIEAPKGAGFSDDFADTLAILAHELRPSRTSGTASVGIGHHVLEPRPDLMTERF